MRKINVVKVGGAVLEDPSALKIFLNAFASVEGHKILVHGGGREATHLSERLGIETKMIDGRRITDEQTLDIVTMVYGGLINKKVVAHLQMLGINSIGLCGADANLIISNKRPLLNGIDYGFVGDVKKIETNIISLLLDNNITPVIAPLSYSGNGGLLNTNADTIAAEIAKSISKQNDVTLTYCFELPGVLRNPEDKDTVIRHIDSTTFEQLASEGIITGGMLPKIENALDTVEKGGVKRVLITGYAQLGDKNTGTEITTCPIKAIDRC